MVWSLQFQLLNGEEVLENSVDRPQSAVRTAYSVFLTTRRVVFRFDGFGSHLIQSFKYPEILGIKLCKRLFVNYLVIKTVQKDYFLNVPETEYWAERILRTKEEIGPEPPDEEPVAPEATGRKKKQELLEIIKALHENSVLSDAEMEEKIKLLEGLGL